MKYVDLTSKVVWETDSPLGFKDFVLAFSDGKLRLYHFVKSDWELIKTQVITIDSKAEWINIYTKLYGGVRNP
jgi:hypothetical protein